MGGIARAGGEAGEEQVGWALQYAYVEADLSMSMAVVVVSSWRACFSRHCGRGPAVGMVVRQSGAAASVVTPRDLGNVWHHALTEMASEELVVEPRARLFRPGQRARREGIQARGGDHDPGVVPPPVGLLAPGRVRGVQQVVAAVAPESLDCGAHAVMWGKCTSVGEMPTLKGVLPPGRDNCR
eukprot:jgi/Tetstr1/428108/TSEL_018163.t1